MKTIIKFAARIIISVPVIAVGILDVALYFLNLLKLNIQIPGWVYWLLLLLGLLIKSYQIFIELEKEKSKGDISCTLLDDPIAGPCNEFTYVFQGNPDIRRSFGFEIATSSSKEIHSNIFADFTFYWRGDMPNKAINIMPPANNERWDSISTQITSNKPAKLIYNGENDIFTKSSPIILWGLSFHLREFLNGYIEIKCNVKSKSPSDVNENNLFIRVIHNNDNDSGSYIL